VIVPLKKFQEIGLFAPARPDEAKTNICTARSRVTCRLPMGGMESFFPLRKKFLHVASRESGARVFCSGVSEGKAALEALARSMRTAEGSAKADRMKHHCAALASEDNDDL